MKQANSRFIFTLALIFVALISVSLAQQVGDNVNVLPGYKSDPADSLRGDGYLQRQVEPAIAASSRNPDNLLAAFIDFRAVEFEGGSAPPTYEAAAEAWIGLSRSYDRGRTWFGSMVPGFDGDVSLLGLSSPLHGLTAGGDPVLAAATNGRFYLGGLFFDRGGISKIAVIRYQDFPEEGSADSNKDGGDNIRYLGAAIVDAGSATDDGNFNDKPVIIADIARGGKKAAPEAGTCGSVYVAYTNFRGGQTAPFTSKIAFVRSKEGRCGEKWDKPIYLNKNWPQSHGAALAIDPVSGKIYVVWRHFKTIEEDTRSYPDAILMATSDDGGATFTDPAVIAEGPDFMPYDQFGISTEVYPDRQPTFRSNAYPTIAVDGSGNVYVAIQEHHGDPDSPRIMVRTLLSGSNAWSDAIPVDDPDDSLNSHQVMPVFSSGGGQLRLMWYDFGEALQGDNQTGEDVELDATRGISGIERKVNVRLAQATVPPPPGEDNPDFSDSVQVSQYYIDVYTGEIADVPNALPRTPALNRPNLPMYASGLNAFASDYISLVSAQQFVRDESGPLPWRWAYKPTDYGARSSFAVWYDTRDVLFPNNSFDPYNPDWIAAWQNYDPPGASVCSNPGSRNGNTYFAEIKPGIVVGSHALHRQLVDGNGDPIQRALPMYVENPNGPVADDLTEAYPNPYGSRFFHLAIQDSPGVFGSFVQPQDWDDPDAYSEKDLYVEILPFSTASATVFVYCEDCSDSVRSMPIRVDVKQIIGGIDSDTGEVADLTPQLGPHPEGLMSTITFNADPTSPDVRNIDLAYNETHGLDVDTPQYGNPQYGSPQYGSPQYGSPQYGSPQYGSPQYGSPQYGSPQYGSPQYGSPQYGSTPIGDFTWRVTNEGNATSAYTSVTNIVADMGENYKYEVVLWRKYETPTVGNDCTTVQQTQNQVISIIPNPQYGNPQYGSPQYGNPQYGSPQYGSAQYADATFSVAPASGASSSQVQTLAAASLTADSEIIEAPRTPDEVFITLRVFATEGTASPFENNPVAQNEFLQRVTQVITPEAADIVEEGGMTVVEPDAEAVVCVGTQPCQTIVANSTPTTTTIESVDPEPSLVGDDYVVSVMVDTGGAFGQLTISNGQESCIIDDPADGLPQTCTLSSASVGQKVITATFVPDESNAYSFSAASYIHQVQANTSTVLAASLNPSLYEQDVTFTATVTVDPPGAGTPSGTVDFIDTANGMVLSSATLSNGIATFSISSLSAGQHYIRADYAGANNYIESASNIVNQVVDPILEFGALPSNVSFGQPLGVTVTASGLLGGPINGLQIRLDRGQLGGGGDLSGYPLAYTDDTGQAAFPGLSFDDGGDGYTLVATATSSGVSVESDPFDILGISFERLPGGTIPSNIVLTDQLSSRGVEFSYSGELSGAVRLIDTGMYDPDGAPPNHAAILLTAGVMSMHLLEDPTYPTGISFTQSFSYTAGSNPTSPTPIIAYDGSNNEIDASQIRRTNRWTYLKSNGNLFTVETVTITDPIGISLVDFNVGGNYAPRIDNLYLDIGNIMLADVAVTPPAVAQGSPANIDITLTEAATGDPIQGAAVTVTAGGGSFEYNGTPIYVINGTTDGTGLFHTDWQCNPPGGCAAAYIMGLDATAAGYWPIEDSPLSVSIIPVISATTLSVDNNTLGVQLTASVKPGVSIGVVPTGTVTVALVPDNGGPTIESIVGLNQYGNAIFDRIPLEPGVYYTVTATYSGDTIFGASSTSPIVVPGLVPVTITGSVVWNGIPVPNASVVLKDGNNYYSDPVLASTTTASDGTFTLTEAVPGNRYLYWVAPVGHPEYWDWAGFDITITADMVSDVGPLALFKKMTPVAPADRSTTTSTPTLIWEAFPDADHYSVIVHQNTAPNALVFNADNVVGTQIAIDELPPGEYQWSVSAFNANGDEIAYYSAWAFTIN